MLFFKVSCANPCQVAAERSQNVTCPSAFKLPHTGLSFLVTPEQLYLLPYEEQKKRASMWIIKLKRLKQRVKALK